MFKEVKPADFFIVRNPRFSNVTWDLINNCHTAESFWQFATELLADPQVFDAITIASYDLANQLNDLLNEPFGDKTRKLLPALYKYISRMANRPTPFGKFSSISIGEISNNQTDLILGDNFVSKYRLDLVTQVKINQELLENLEILENIKFYPNTTIINNGDSFTYIENIYGQVNTNYNWSKINSNSLIKFILLYAENGKNFKDILAYLLEMGISEEKCRKFICELINSKILISETHPITTKDDDYLLNQAVKLSKNSELEYKLIEISNKLKMVNEESTCPYDDFNSNIFIEALYDNSKNIFQVDTTRTLEKQILNKKDIDLLTKEIFELRALNRAQIPKDLKDFCKKFASRYGDQEIPLLEALDPENGIGYGITTKFISNDYPLLLDLGNYEGKETAPRSKTFQEDLIDKYLIDNISEQKVIELKNEDISINSLKVKFEETIPLGFYVFGNLLKTKETDSGKQSLRFHLTTCGGVSALPLLTRFSYLNNELKSKLEELAIAEQNNANGAILAEIIFSPNCKSGNILRRPSLFSYEIPIIGQSSKDNEHTILLSDLVVKVHRNTVFLRLKRLNKRVLPRLSSAHNFHYGMSVYRFLCDLQLQDNPINISWDWGESIKKPFLPRVVYKHLVLSRAQWNISSSIFRNHTFKNNDEKIHFLLSKFQLPRKVILIQGDNEMYLDLHHELSKDILLKELNKKDIKLSEDLYDNFDSVFINKNGEKVNNEVLIPFLGRPKIYSKELSYNSNEDVIRSFTPGSEWLYLKVYCGEKPGDSILRNQINKLITSLKSSDLIEKWFFIRFYDPDPHLRIRLKLKGNLNTSFYLVTRFIQDIFTPLIDHRIVTRIIFDTYERELERYGPHNMEICESIFCLESDVILELLVLIKQEGEALRWKFALLIISIFLKTFGFENEQKINLLEQLRNDFLQEFKHHPNAKYIMDQKFRSEIKEINHFMENMDSINPRAQILLRKYEVEMYFFAKLCQNNIDFQIKPNAIISSLIHMLLNRIFYTHQREQEMVIYHFLTKYLYSQQKKNTFFNSSD
ncbi:lantibiotic dehydratase [Sphingobacterium sp. Lzh-3]|uniref:lantibiotic dehydratase n=1 Tax=Sphingobacterium sp. Lzh-3 TaxID=3382150 RepID=UPI00398D4750